MTRIEQAPEAVLTLPPTTNASMAAMSNAEARRPSRRSLPPPAALEGHIVELLGEAERHQSYRDDGATSAANWSAERFELRSPAPGPSSASRRRHGTSRNWCGVLQSGEISFDKLRAIADVATPESDAALLEEARVRSVHGLAVLARTRRTAAPPDSAADHDRRSLRCNDEVRTMTVQLPPESFAEAKSRLESLAKEVPSGNGESTWDQRMADAFMGLIRGGRAGREPVPTSSWCTFRQRPSSPKPARPRSWPATWSGAASSTSTRYAGWCVTPRSRWPSTTAWGTRCTRGGRAGPDGARSIERCRRRDRHCRFPGAATGVHECAPHRGMETRSRPDEPDNLALLWSIITEWCTPSNGRCPATRTTC